MTAVTIVPVVAAVIRQPRAPDPTPDPTPEPTAEPARFLLALRPPEKRHGGLWEFPGGKVAPGETEPQALARELDEELGVALDGCGVLLAAYRDPGSPFEIRFRDAEVRGIPQAREHTELRWVTVEESRCLPLAPTDRRFVEEVLGGPDPTTRTPS